MGVTILRGYGPRRYTFRRYMFTYTVQATKPKRTSKSDALYKERRTYDVTLYEDDFEIITKAVPSVTTILDAMGGDKTQRLVGWAKRETYHHIQAAFARLDLGEEVGKLQAEVASENSPPAAESVLQQMVMMRTAEEGRSAFEQESRRVKDFGSRAHDILKELLTGNESVDIPDDLTRVVQAGQAWLRDEGITPIAIEIPVFQVKYPVVFMSHQDLHQRIYYAGTVDGIGLDRSNELVIWDWKTGGLYAEGRMQLAAYAAALHSIQYTNPDIHQAMEHTDNFPVRGYLVQIPREYSEGMDPWKVETIDSDELNRLGGVFDCAVPIYRWQDSVREAEKAEKEKARSDG
jgi:hypothetical protein